MKAKRKIILREKAFFLILLFFLQILYIFWSGKDNFHVDEFYTYGLANNVGGMNPVLEDGKVYSNMGPYEEYLTVAKSGEGRFDYSNVWENQAVDVHPPLYYVFIHTICSFFPGVFTKWFGIAFNVLCLGIINILAFCIGRKLFKNESMGIIFAIINGTTFITMNMALFIRMYALMTIFTMAIILLFLNYMESVRLKWGFWIQLYLYSVLGTMTQYYFLIFLFWACLFYGVNFVVKHQWKNVCKFLGCLCAAGLTCVCIFPAMLEQIFGSGYRGKQAFENVRGIGNFFENLKGYLKIIDASIFGNVFIPVTFVCVLIFFLIIDRGKIQFKIFLKKEIKLVLVSVVGYLIVIIKIAPYITDRYIMPVAWMIVLLFLYFLYKIFQICLKHKSNLYIHMGIIGISVFMIIISYYNNDWKVTYSYTNTKEQLDIAEEYQENSVIYVYDESWKTMPNMLELMKYKDYQFSTVENLSNILMQRQDKSLIVYIMYTIDNNSVLQQILNSETDLDHYEALYYTTYATTYYLN